MKYSQAVDRASAQPLPFIEAEEDRLSVSLRPTRIVEIEEPGVQKKDLFMHFVFGDAAPQVSGAMNMIKRNKRLNRAVAVGAVGLGSLIMGSL